LNRAVLKKIVDEIAPRLKGGRITGIFTPAQDCLVLKISAPASLYLGVLAMKALPTVFLAEDCVGAEEEEHPTSGAARQLRGAEVLSFSAVGDEPVAELLLRRTDSAGRAVDRTLRIDLGIRPSLSVRDAPSRTHGGCGGGDAREGRARIELPLPSVGWRRDAAGKLHVRLSPRGDPWDGTRNFETWNDAASYAFREFFPVLELERRRANVEKAVRRELARKLRAVDKVSAEMADAGRADEYRRKAQLLLTRQGEIRKGVTPVRVLDYDGASVVEIEVDPMLSPTRNAEILFRRARKADRRAERVPKRLAELEHVVSELRQTLDEIAAAPSARVTELEAQFHPPPPAGARRRDDTRARFRTYAVSGGWEVLVGKSNRDNDTLTHRIARQDDLWFHVRQAAGSHVVLRRAGRKAEPDMDAIREAASIAAYYSKARKSSNVAVCYTERRHVRKPRGAKPGLAVVSREKVVFVDPGLPRKGKYD
jgi:predicted ribosome quality control (RQC) complex YloA/Tae2 family protein